MIAIKVQYQNKIVYPVSIFIEDNFIKGQVGDSEIFLGYYRSGVELAFSDIMAYIKQGEKLFEMPDRGRNGAYPNFREIYTI